MFIYKYMADNIEIIVGGEDDENYDPHEHRNIPKPTTYAETMTHMLKGSMGAGLLAMPSAVHRMGIIFGPIGIMLIGIFATFCIQLLIYAEYKICKKHKRGYMAYHKCMKKALQAGPPCMRWSANIFSQGVDSMLIIWQIGVCAVYFVFVAENVKQILDYYGIETSLRLIICYSYPILLVTCMIKDLKLLAPFSTFSNVCTVIGLILTFYYLIEDEITIDDDKFLVKGLDEVPVFIGITLFALEAVGVMLALEYNMKDPKEFTGVFGLFSLGMAIILGTYIILGIFGHLKYGDEVEAAITLNLPHEQTKAQTAKITFAVAIFLSYPLQNFVAWQIIWRKFKKAWKPTHTTLTDYILRIIVATIPFALAVAAPTLGPFMGLIGALCLSAVAIVFPAIMDLAIHYTDDYGCCKYKLIIDIFIITFGSFCLFSGVYTSLLEMYEIYL